MDERLEQLGRILASLRRAHHHRQPRILEADRARARGNLDIDRARHRAVRVDVTRMRTARFHDIDPQAVEPEPAPELKGASVGESCDMPVEQLDQVGEARAALRQVVERGIGGVTAITMRLRPAAPGAIVLGELAARIGQLVEQVGIAEFALVERRGEQVAHAHAPSPSRSAMSFMNRTSSPCASHGASAAIAPSRSARSSISALAKLPSTWPVTRSLCPGWPMPIRTRRNSGPRWASVERMPLCPAVPPPRRTLTLHGARSSSS